MTPPPWVVSFAEGFNTFILFYFLVLNSTYLLLFFLSLGEILRFVRRTYFSDYRQIMQSEMTWPISILVPAHNEEKTIVETVQSLMRVSYGEFEIIVVSDGSVDGTVQRLIEHFELRRMDRMVRRSLETRPVRGIYGSLVHRNLVVVDKERGGKADALNAGINLSRYPLFCSFDADSVIEDNALLKVVKPFMEHPAETVAAGGIVRIANGCEVRDGRVTRIGLPDRLLPILQVVEYLREFLIGRVSWSFLRSVLIISGAFGLYRKDVVIEIGGYSNDTDTEDLELVVRLHRHLRERKLNYRIVFVPDPVCWTEVPASIPVLWRQRNRWHRGLIQTLLPRWRMLFNPRFGPVGLVGIPFFLFFEMLGPFVEFLGYGVVVVSYLVGLLSTEFLILFITVAIIYGILLSIAAVLLEEISFRRYPGWLNLAKLIIAGVVEHFGYRQMVALFKVKAFLDVIGRRRGWGRMDRVGFRRERSRREDSDATRQLEASP
jgi:cellulose synthase/poly-beta-1,6-N-acetylglucosamine synthase-like glycosyltransferase